MEILNINLKFEKVEEYDNKNNEWINYGTDNLYPQKIVQYYNDSPVNQSIVEYKKNLTAGEGFIYDENQKVTDFNKRIKSNVLLSRTSLDYSLYGGFAFQITANSLGKIGMINYIDFSTLRKSKDGKKIYVSKDWKQYKKKEYTPVCFNVFNIQNLANDMVQIYYFGDLKPAMHYYPTPDYNAGLGYVELEKEIQTYHLNCVKNGYFPSLHITFPEKPSPEERQQIKQKLEDAYKGSQGAGNVVVSFTEDMANKIQIDSITSNNNADLLNALSELVTSKIITSHKLTSPELIGISSGGSSLGGDANKISVAYDYFYSTVIKPKQITIIDVFNELYSYNDFNVQNLTIANTKPLTYIPESLLQLYWTESEIREIYGYEEKELADKLIDAPAVDIEAQAKANLRGSVGGVQSILAIQQAVSQGLSDYNSAVALLEEIFGFTNEIAKQVLGTPKIV